MRVAVPLLAVLLLAPSMAEAIPRFALRQGAPCAMCHVDPSGGGMRNDYGRSVFAATTLPTTTVTLPSGAPALDGRVSEAVALGADIRLLYHHMRKAGAKTPRMDSFYIMEATPYIAVDLWDYLTLYFAPSFHGSESFYFEASAIVRVPWEGFYVKLGRFTAPYGLKIPDHSRFIRKQNGFNVLNKETGIEVGINPGPVSIQVAAFNGIPERVDSDWDDNAALGVSARIAVNVNTRWAKLTLGGSVLYNVGGNAAADDPTGRDTRIEEVKVGGFAGLSVGRFSWLGEFDYTRTDDRLQPKIVGQLFSYQELTFLIIRGLDLVLNYELWDQDIEIADNAVHRIGGGFQIFAWPYSEVDIKYRYSAASSLHPLSKVHELMVIAHVFF